MDTRGTVPDTVLTCDAVVVGGGPAGSTCAWQLTRAGYDVVVLDRATFPRDKPCAGWITPAVVASLELPLASYAPGRVLQAITGFRTGLIGGPAIDTQYDEVVSYGILRREFDAFLLDRSGARVRQGEPLRSMHRRRSSWVINGSITTPVVVGAGGHFCPVARHVSGRQRGREPVVVAQEVEFTLSDPDACVIGPERPELYFSPDLKGYGWCFRKQSLLNVGLGRQDSRALTAHVHQFLGWLQGAGRLPATLAGTWKGHAYLLAGESRRAVIDDGVLLVGDAAGLAYPASGEGIRPAVESGILAATTIVATNGDVSRAALEPYEAALRARYGACGATRRSLLGEHLVARLGAMVLSSQWLTRHVFLPRVFLQPGRRQPPVPAVAAPAVS